MGFLKCDLKGKLNAGNAEKRIFAEGVFDGEKIIAEKLNFSLWNFVSTPPRGLFDLIIFLPLKNCIYLITHYFPSQFLPPVISFLGITTFGFSLTFRMESALAVFLLPSTAWRLLSSFMVLSKISSSRVGWSL